MTGNNVLDIDPTETKETKPEAEASPTPSGLTEEERSALAKLVGEGKKFKSEEDLAKGKLESDKFIERLLDEQKERDQEIHRLHEELRVAKTTKEMDELRSQISQRQSEDKSKETTAPVLAAEDLEKMIEEHLTVRETRKSASDNVNQTNEALVKHFGTPEKAQEVVLARAEELGVSVKDIKQMAAKSPSAALALVTGSASQQPANKGLDKTSSAFTDAAAGSGTLGVKAEFEKLRREDPKKYWSPAVQNRIFQAIKEGTYQ